MTSIVTISASGGGVSVFSTETNDSEVSGVLNVTVDAGKTGALTTRTDANTGTLTMDAGHGITTGARLDIHWLDATTGLPKCQYKVTAGTVSGNTVPIDLGVGDNLPALVSGTYPVVVQVANEYDMSFLTANLEVLFCGATNYGKLVLEKSDGTVVFNKTFGAAGAGYAWTATSGGSNPVSDDVAKAFVTNGSSSASNTVSAFAGLTP